jgi:ABC-type amino acid transport substrate-binding protein
MRLECRAMKTLCREAASETARYLTSRRVWLAVPILLVAVACSPPATEPPEPDEVPEAASSAPALVVTSDFTNDLFARWPDGGEPEGFEPRLAREIAAELRRPVEWKRLEFNKLIDAVIAGRADIVIASTGVTPERSRRVDFSRSYFVTRIDVVVRAADGIGKIEELDGRRVSASRGTTSALALETRLPGAEAILDRPPGVSAAAMLRNGTVDGALMDGPDAARVVADDPTLRILDAPAATERYAAAVQLGNTELLRAVDTVISRLEREGQLRSWAREEGLIAD